MLCPSKSKHGKEFEIDDIKLNNASAEKIDFKIGDEQKFFNRIHMKEEIISFEIPEE